MKLGFFTMPVHPPARSYVETLKEDREAFILADRLGYSEGYCGEHLTDAAENIPNSMMFIATLLGVTSQIKVGTAVINLPHTHPVVVAIECGDARQPVRRADSSWGLAPAFSAPTPRHSDCSRRTATTCLPKRSTTFLPLWAGKAPFDLKGKYWTISTEKTLWPEVGIGNIVKPFQKPHPPIAGTATEPESKGLIALGRRGWWPISSHFLHLNCLKQPMGQLRPRLRRGRPQGRSRQLASGAVDLRRRGRQGGTGLWRRRSQQSLSLLHEPAHREAEEGEAHGRLQVASRHARRGHYLRLHLRQHRDPRQRQPGRRPHPGAARDRSATSERCCTAARTGPIRSSAASPWS